MIAARALFGVAAGALVAAGLLVAPVAVGATDKQSARIIKHPAAAVRALGGFTPASADPRLAALFARGGLAAGSFRFTPADSHASSRAVTVAVRAHSNRSSDTGQLAAVASAAPAAGLVPIAYNLGVAVGWKSFALAGDMSHVDLGQLPGSREAADVSVSYLGRRFSGRVKATTDRPIGDLPALTSEQPTYSVNVAGSYSLTRNLNVTAGVRYRADRDRLAHVEDNRRDSQAVYVGTALRF